MSTRNVSITGWKPGFHKIAIIKLLQQECGLSQEDAKEATDKLLAGETLTISAADWNNFTKLAAEAGAETTLSEAA